MKEKLDTIYLDLERKRKMLAKYKSAHMTEILKTRRSDLGMTQKDLADHYCNTGLSKYENRHIEGNPMVIRELGRALDMDADALLSHYMNEDLMKKTIDAFYMCDREVLVASHEKARKTNVAFFHGIYELFVCVYDRRVDKAHEIIHDVTDGLSHLDLLSTIAYLYLQAEVAYLERRCVLCCQLLKLLKPVADHHPRIQSLYHQLSFKVALENGLTLKTATHVLASCSNGLSFQNHIREMEIPLLLMAKALIKEEPIEKELIHFKTPDTVPDRLYNLYLYVYLRTKQNEGMMLDEKDYALISKDTYDPYYYLSLSLFYHITSLEDELNHAMRKVPGWLTLEKVYLQVKCQKKGVAFIRDIALPLAYRHKHIEWINYYSDICMQDASKRKRYKEVAERQEKMRQLKKTYVSLF